MTDRIPPDDTVTDVLTDMAGVLWRLLRNGYVSAETSDDECYSECEHLRNMAHDTLDRARLVLGVDKPGA